MNIVLFIHHDSSGKGAALKATIENNFQSLHLKTVHSSDTLKSELKKSHVFLEKKIFIILADSETRLDKLSSMIDLMEGRQIVLIIPEESKKIISKASRFFPRFFTPVSDAYDDLCSVLIKMTTHNNSNTKYCAKGDSENVRIY